jgi:hypothetical protein
MAGARWSGFFPDHLVVRLSGSAFRGAALARGVDSELDAMGIVDDPVEDGIGKGRLVNRVMPAIDRDLAGDQGAAAAIAVFANLEDEMACRVLAARAPIIQGQGV